MTYQSVGGCRLIAISGLPLDVMMHIKHFSIVPLAYSCYNTLAPLLSACHTVSEQHIKGPCMLTIETDDAWKEEKLL